MLSDTPTLVTSHSFVKIVSSTYSLRYLVCLQRVTGSNWLQQNVRETLPSGDRATQWRSPWVFPVLLSSKFPVEVVSLLQLQLQSSVVVMERQQFGDVNYVDRVSQLLILIAQWTPSYLPHHSTCSTEAMMTVFTQIPFFFRSSVTTESVALPVSTLQSGYHHLYLATGGKMAAAKIPSIFVRIHVSTTPRDICHVCHSITVYIVHILSPLLCMYMWA